jgi:hypothetical protein
VPVEKGFQSLFDGSLDNWDKFGDGQIQALPGLDIIECGENGTDSLLGFVRTRSKFRNFQLRLGWKAFDIRANSGIFLRMAEIDQRDLSRTYEQSIEIQIDETGKRFKSGDPTVYGSSLHKTGAIYGLAPASQWAAKAISPRFSCGFWNAFDILLEDDVITVALNGKRVVDSFQLPPSLLNEGFIGLQCHTGIVQFRNIRIRPL